MIHLRLPLLDSRNFVHLSLDCWNLNLIRDFTDIWILLALQKEILYAGDPGVAHFFVNLRIGVLCRWVFLGLGMLILNFLGRSRGYFGIDLGLMIWLGLTILVDWINILCFLGFFLDLPRLGLGLVGIESIWGIFFELFFCG